MIPMVWYEVTWYWKEKDMEPYTTPPEWVPEIKELDHLIGTQKWVTEVPVESKLDGECSCLKASLPQGLHKQQ